MSRFPAEWEPQKSVWLSWPRYDNVRDLPVAPTVATLAARLSDNVDVDILVSNNEMRKTAQDLISTKGGHPEKIHFHLVSNNEIWIRDFGPIFLKEGATTKVATFRFNYWGYSQTTAKESRDEDQVDGRVAEILRLPKITSGFISEGGNREFNGSGAMMAVWAVEKQRNPHRTKEQVEREFKRIFGVRKVIWLPYGVMEDDLTFQGPLPGPIYTCITTGGHVDNTARFVNDHTVLLAQVTKEEAKRSPISAESRRRLELDYRELSKATDAFGRKFSIIRMPTPDLNVRNAKPGDGVYDFISNLKYDKPFPKGKPVKVVAAASYMNFLISNGQVITSALWKPGRPKSTKEKDELAQAILRKVFPTRKIVPIDAESVNLGGGGIHCITQQQPK